MDGRRHLVPRLALASLVLAAVAGGTTGIILATRSPRPHVVLISIDTLRRDHIGAYGYERETTPNIDQLLAESAVFDEAIAACTNTAPPHASILTGLYPPTHGIRRNGFTLKNGVRTLGKVLPEPGGYLNE